jgi:malic enzyme
MKVNLRGRNLLRDPLLNKGTAFTAGERAAFDLEGLLPSQTLTIERQAERIWESLMRNPEPLDQYVALAALQERNEHLYFHILIRHLEQLMPVVYTPTVGLATQKYSHVFQRGRGLWITPEHRGRVARIVASAIRGRDVRLIVATDNESILGIGDQGAGGMAIAVGKLSLYTAIAGVNPAQVLPVSLDVGTDNESLLADPVYVGYRERRLRGNAYLELMDEFVDAVERNLPQALIQWEDLRKDNALAVLERYRRRIPSFNDDIQGTGAVALAGLLTAGRITGRQLGDERVVIHGAGAAGLGITRQLRAAMSAAGVSDDRCRRAVAVLDSSGLLIDNGGLRDAYKRELAWTVDDALAAGITDADRSLEAVVRHFRPTTLIGTSGQKGAFTESIVRAMADEVERPLVLPLSNPTENCEVTPAELIAWTAGRALVATGSPFAPVERGGRSYPVGQGNNAFIFPAVGLAALAGGIREISDGLFSAAARGLADAVTADELSTGLLFPPIRRSREVCRQVALAVLRSIAVEPGQGSHKTSPEELIGSLAWEPIYQPYTPA